MRCATSLTDTGTGADDDYHLPGEFFFRRHASKLGLLQQPVLDIESLLLRQRDIFIDRFGAAHDFDRAVVEFGRHSRFRFVFAPGNHSQTRESEITVGFGSRMAGESGRLQRW